MTGQFPARPGAVVSRRLAIVLLVVFSGITLTGAAAVAALLLLRPPPPPADPDVEFGPTGPAIAVGTKPADVEAGAGFVWVSGSGDGSLTRIDPTDGSTRRIEVGGEPGQIVVGDGAVWVRNLGDRITRVDAATGRVSAPIDGGGQINGMAVGGGYVWLSHRSQNTVSRVDTRTLALLPEPIEVGPEPTVMEFDDRYAYVLGSGEGTLTRIAADTGVPAGTVTVGSSLGGMEVEDGVVYVAADGGVAAVRADTFAVLEPYSYVTWSYFEVTGGIMWVVHDRTSTIVRYDLATRAPVGRPVPGYGENVGRARYAFDRLWLTIPGDDAVVPIGPVGASSR